MGKDYVIFAGVNGAGKSTFYNHLSGFPIKRVNSDEILKQMGGNWENNTDQANAMKEAVRRINEYLKKGISFNQETTLTGNSIINNIRKAKEQGYAVKVYYVGLESADLAVQRVGKRVSQGGHGIEEEDIRRRYKQSLENLKKIIPVCDIVEIYDNTKNFTSVATYKNGQQILKKDCEWLDRTLQGEIKESSKNNLEKREESFSMNDWESAVERPGNNTGSIGLHRQIDNSVEMDERE